ncbi:PIG-L deacetylase family protein [Aestuariimicrobium ganziense]|uniref:PIG-L deacetylase family protein n=1 Tax=Aestuariimicrobium ganziense TaxID=2773677 RepID=UPI001941836C|nr:PIG-L deacetylase family protein [Aestuariimicrobium ganziense]
MTLPAFTEPLERVLCVVAHPDDMEYGTSAAVAKWTSSDTQVAYLLLTAGEAGMQRPPEEVGPLRAAEQRAACEQVGVSELTILNHPDGVLQYSLDLRRDIARAIREFRPTAVVTPNFEVEAYGGYNQADHRVAGLACLDAIRDADNTWVFPELAKDGLPKWATTWLLIAGHNEPTHGVEVDEEHVAASVRSLECHEAYLADIPAHPVPAQFIPEMLAGGGQAMGVEHAATFKVVRMGGLGAED